MHFSRAACLFRCSETSLCFLLFIACDFYLAVNNFHIRRVEWERKKRTTASHFKQLNCAINNLIYALYMASQMIFYSNNWSQICTLPLFTNLQFLLPCLLTHSERILISEAHLATRYAAMVQRNPRRFIAVPYSSINSQSGWGWDQRSRAMNSQYCCVWQIAWNLRVPYKAYSS